MRAPSLLLVMNCWLGCANNNVAELAGKVRVVDRWEETQGCRPVGRVGGAALTLTGARQQAQRRALFLGANLIVVGEKGRMTGNMRFSPGGNAYSDPYNYRGGMKGFAFECDRLERLASQLTGVTFVEPARITVAPAKPEGCDETGAPIEAFSDGRPGSAEEGLRRLAELAEANYVQILKTVDYDGRPALRAQAWWCPVR
jgi:hypothetical protein